MDNNKLKRGNQIQSVIQVLTNEIEKTKNKIEAQKDSQSVYLATNGAFSSSLITDYLPIEILTFLEMYLIKLELGLKALQDEFAAL